MTASTETAQSFTFEVASLKTVDGRTWTAVVQFDGSAAALRDATSKIRVNTRTVQEPTDDVPRLLELSGNGDAVFQAIGEYGRIAVGEQAYTLGDLFSNNNW